MDAWRRDDDPARVVVNARHFALGRLHTAVEVRHSARIHNGAARCRAGQLSLADSSKNWHRSHGDDCAADSARVPRAEMEFR